MSRHPAHPSRPGRSTPPTNGSVLLQILSDAFCEISGIEYWTKLPLDGRFSLVKHIKRTVQLAGCLTMAGFTTYAFSNWIQWYQFNISNRWDFFGSHFHTVVIATIAALSSVYLATGVGTQAYEELKSQHEKFSYQYLGSSYDL